MKLGVFSVALASASNIKKGEEVPGENGWEVRCRLELDHPPAFAYLTQKGDLYYTTFGVVGVDAVYRRVQILTKIWDSRNWCTQLRIKDYNKNCDNAKPEKLFTDFPWPNSLQEEDIPDSIFGEGWMSVSAGFFPQNKNDGCVGFFNQNNPHLTLTYLTPGCKHDDVEHDSFFYHKIEWVDMDNDGDLDAVSARVINDGPIDPIAQDLIWMENPGTGQPPKDGYDWTMHKIAAANHADVFFNVGRLPRRNGSGDQIVIAVGGFYSQKLDLVWTEDPNDNWKNIASQKSLVLDEAGWYFEVEWEDVNHDGKKDILATTWSRTGENGQSMAYELNGLNWQDKNAWIRHDIFTRFPKFLNAGFGSPGGFSVAKQQKGDKKDTIYVSGDDDGMVYRHTPASDMSSSHEARLF